MIIDVNDSTSFKSYSLIYYLSSSNPASIIDDSHDHAIDNCHFHASTNICHYPSH